LRNAGDDVLMQELLRHGLDDANVVVSECEAVGSDSLAGVFGSDDACQGVQAGFCGRVGDTSGDSDPAQHRRDEDDAPESELSHSRQDPPAQSHRAGEVYLHRLVPGLVIVLVDHVVRRNALSVDQHGATDILCNGLDKGIGTLPVLQVQMTVVGPSLQRRRLLAAIRSDDPGRVSKLLHEELSNAARSACDDQIVDVGVVLAWLTVHVVPQFSVLRWLATARVLS